jgi:hypothetical protein
MAAAPPPPPPSRTHINWDEAYQKHGFELTRYEEMLESYERESGISLTPGAIEMIFVPLLEVLNREKGQNFSKCPGPSGRSSLRLPMNLTREILLANDHHGRL